MMKKIGALVALGCSRNGEAAATPVFE